MKYPEKKTIYVKDTDQIEKLVVKTTKLWCSLNIRME